MNKITKKIIKRIKAGNHDDLIDAIEFLIDTHNEDKFDAGYASCIEDLSVRSYRLAEHICDAKGGGKGKDKDGNPIKYLEVDELAKVIEDYFTEALKK